eukprot:403336039
MAKQGNDEQPSIKNQNIGQKNIGNRGSQAAVNQTQVRNELIPQIRDRLAELDDSLSQGNISIKHKDSYYEVPLQEEKQIVKQEKKLDIVIKSPQQKDIVHQNIIQETEVVNNEPKDIKQNTKQLKSNKLIGIEDFDSRFEDMNQLLTPSAQKYQTGLVSTRNQSMLVRNHLQTPSNAMKARRATTKKKTQKQSVFMFTSNKLDIASRKSGQINDEQQSKNSGDTEMEKFDGDASQFDMQSQSSQNTYFQRVDNQSMSRYSKRSGVDDNQSDTSFARIDDSRSMRSGFSETSFRRIDGTGSMYSGKSSIVQRVPQARGSLQLSQRSASHFKKQPTFDGLSEGQSTIMVEGDQQWDDEYEDEIQEGWDEGSNNTEMINMNDDNSLELTNFDQDANDGQNPKPKKGRSKSLDQGKPIDHKEVVMKKTQMIGYNYDERRMTAKMSELKVRRPLPGLTGNNNNNTSGSMFQFPTGKTPRSRKSKLQSDMQSEINRVEGSYYEDDEEYYEEESVNQSQFRRVDEQSFVDEF